MNGAVVIYQYVSRLEVSVNDLCLVEIFQAAQNVVNNSLDLLLVEMLARLNQLLQVHVALAQHQIDFVELEFLDRSCDDVIDLAR